MAQPIYFDNYSRELRARAAKAPYEALGAGLSNLGQVAEKVLLDYQTRKSAEKQQKLELMTQMGTKFGFRTMGPEFTKEFEALSGVKIPRADDGNPAPISDREMFLMQHGNDAEAMAIHDKLVKPRPSQAELDAGSSKDRLRYLEHQQDNATRLKVAGVNRQTRLDVATMGQGNKAEFSGYYNDGNGHLIPAGRVERNPGRYPKAFKLSNSAYQDQAKNHRARTLDERATLSLDVLKSKIAADKNKGLLDHAFKLIAHYDKIKQPDKAEAVASSVVATMVKHEGLDLTAGQLEAAKPAGGWRTLPVFRNVFGSSQQDPVPSTTTTTTIPDNSQIHDLGDGFQLKIDQAP